MSQSADLFLLIPKWELGYEANAAISTQRETMITALQVSVLFVAIRTRACALLRPGL
jgi:hypothetical protein